MPPQVPLLPERVHGQLQLGVVGLGPVAARARLDGAERGEPGAGLHRPGGHLEAGVHPARSAAGRGGRVLHWARLPRLVSRAGSRGRSLTPHT